MGWYTRLSITCPSSQFLEQLQDHEGKLFHYRISTVEVAVDYIYPARSLVDLSSIVERLAERLAIRYAHKDFSFDASRQNNAKGIFDPDKGLYTCTIGSKSWNLVIYARVSKLTGMNCIHVEWRCLSRW